MNKFTVTLSLGEDPASGWPVLGFEHEGMFIFDPFLSDCGRFPADPTLAYGLSQDEARALKALNDSVSSATDDALNAGCARIQSVLGVESGDVAGVYFSGIDERLAIARTLMQYALHEISMAQAEER